MDLNTGKGSPSSRTNKLRRFFTGRCISKLATAKRHFWLGHWINGFAEIDIAPLVCTYQSTSAHPTEDRQLRRSGGIDGCQILQSGSPCRGWFSSSEYQTMWTPLNMPTNITSAGAGTTMFVYITVLVGWGLSCLKPSTSQPECLTASFCTCARLWYC
jgi:hypothetical protein